MHESVGVPSTRTVQAPQWPSPHATFVPVRPSSSLRTAARERPTGASTWYAPPLTLISGTGGHRDDVSEMDEPERQPRGGCPIGVVLELGQRAPQVTRREQKLPDSV